MENFSARHSINGRYYLPYARSWFFFPFLWKIGFPFLVEFNFYIGTFICMLQLKKNVKCISILLWNPYHLCLVISYWPSLSISPSSPYPYKQMLGCWDQLWKIVSSYLSVLINHRICLCLAECSSHAHHGIGKGFLFFIKEEFNLSRI